MCYVHNQWYDISCATLYFCYTSCVCLAECLCFCLSVTLLLLCLVNNALIQHELNTRTCRHPLSPLLLTATYSCLWVYWLSFRRLFWLHPTFRDDRCRWWHRSWNYILLFRSLSDGNVDSWLKSGTAAFQQQSTTTPVTSAPTFRYRSLAYYVEDFRSQTVEGSLYCRRHEVTIERQ